MSTVAATKKALVSVLGGLMDGVQVTYADDVRAPRKQRVYCGDVEENSAEPSAMRAGKVRTMEDYTLRVVVLVDSKGGVMAAETRALELIGVLEDALALDPKLTGAAEAPGILFATFGGYTLSSSLVSEGEARSMAEVDIMVKARNV